MCMMDGTASGEIFFFFFLLGFRRSLVVVSATPMSLKSFCGVIVKFGDLGLEIYGSSWIVAAANIELNGYCFKL